MESFDFQMLWFISPSFFCPELMIFAFMPLFIKLSVGFEWTFLGLVPRWKPHQPLASLDGSVVFVVIFAISEFYQPFFPQLVESCCFYLILFPVVNLSARYSNFLLPVKPGAFWSSRYRSPWNVWYQRAGWNVPPKIGQVVVSLGENLWNAPRGRLEWKCWNHIT